MSNQTNLEFEPVKRMLTISQAAQALSLSTRTIASMVSAGTLRSIKIGGSRRIAADAIKAIAEKGSEGSSSK